MTTAPEGGAQRTLLLGMGNPILCDDAVGVRLAADVRARLGRRTDLDTIEECSIGGLELLPLIEGYARLIVLDSIKTRNGVPGTLYAFTAEALRETMHLPNVHDANFATALELGRRLGTRLPADAAIHILAVEIAENLTFSSAMSPALQAAYPCLLDEVVQAVTGLLAMPASPATS